MKFWTNKIPWLIGILCASLLNGGCDMLYRALDEKGAQEKKLIGEVVPYQRNDVVAEVQNLLYLYGYNTGKIDGILGLRTRNAIEQFQQDNGIEPSRKICKETWEKLTVFKKNELIYNNQLNFRLIQVLLQRAGLDPGNIDGKFGAKTNAAVLKFQEMQGLKVDGKIGYQTLSKLANYIPVGMEKR